ncbi:hypothetical protein [Caballeronia sp. KNU42]
MHNSNIYLYNGYKVVPSAHRLPDGSFASNLLLERHSGSEKGNRYQFHVLDYFKNEAQALGHSREWARQWVDTRG